MNSELEKLYSDLNKFQNTLDSLQSVKDGMDSILNNGGKLSDADMRKYEELKKIIADCQKAINKIKSKISDLTKNNSEVKESDEKGTYKLSGDMIPYRTIDVYRQMASSEQKIDEKEQPKEEQYEPVMPEYDEDYFKKKRREIIAQNAIIATLLVGLGAGIAGLAYEINKNQKNKGTNEQPAPAPETDFYNYEDNTVTIPEIPEDPYANVQNYVEIYRSEYEEMRNLYSLTYADAVDYVNRAHSVQAFNFFPESSIDDIVRLLMNIDNKKLFTNDDNGLTSMLVTVIGQVAENAVWGQPTEEDINKMNALQYLAKDGSDLDEFLTELGEINKRVLSDPYNANEKHNAYLYLRTFIHSFNSYDNMTNYMNEYPETDYGQELSSDLQNGEILTDEVLKEKAMVKDSYDWYFSYNLTSAFASIYAPIDYNEEEFAKWDELWMMGQTALESPQIQEICNNGLTLTLGGE